jgi:hypothetical protein
VRVHRSWPLIEYAYGLEEVKRREKLRDEQLAEAPALLRPTYAKAGT